MTTIRTKETVISAILDYFKENEEVFNDCIKELDGYNGCLGDERYYYMEEIDELYCDCKPSEFAARMFYGYDEDSYMIDRYGRKEYDAFNPNREYFRYNGYGNLVSSDSKDYSAYIDENIIDDMAENRREIYTIDDTPELEELFDALEDCKDDRI